MGWLARLKEWATRDPVSRFDDSFFGSLVLVESWWEATVVLNGRPVTFQIGGRYEPDLVLIANARAICGAFDRFQVSVTAFLTEEAKKDSWSPFTDEIRSLVIHDVALFWPNHPDEGIVFFQGCDPCHHWRCFLTGQTPVVLNFDN